jgi:hypothetical protein
MKAQIMNAKEYFVAAIVLNTVLLAFAGSFWQTKRAAQDHPRTALTGLPGKFGPMIETLLPAAKTERQAEMVDLETGRALLQPPLAYFNSRPDAIMAWIRSNRLDISCSLWPGGAACVTYDMTVVPVEWKCWEQTTEQELLDNPALAPVRHSPRRLLVLGPHQPDTYIFRTGEGTLGMFRIVGLSQHGRGVKIRYKLINPAKSLSVAL